MLRLSASKVAAGALAMLFVFAPLGAAQEGWGTLKGQVVLDGTVPAPRKLEVTKDQDHCLSRGPLYADDLVVNEKNKGVRWVVVWLTDANSPTKALPIHPSLKKVTPERVEIDQPCCQFEPHIVALRQGQTLVVKNSAEVAHNVNIQGGVVNPNVNFIIPARESKEVEGWQGSTTPVSVACNIHPWMKGYIRVFKHPYFAVTDENGNFEIKNAPAGDYRLVVWQESVGWVAGDDAPNKKGKLITIKEGSNDLGKIAMPTPTE